MDRNEVIETLMARFGNDLEEVDNEMLLGRTELDKARMQAAKSLVQLYRECVDNMADAELLGERLKQMREAAVEALLKHYREELAAMSENELQEHEA